MDRESGIGHRRRRDGVSLWRAGRAFGALLLSAPLPLWLGGCATSADPHEGGFVSGVVGLAGGGYQRRIDERETTYKGELSASDRLKAQARELEQERAKVRSDLSSAQKRLATLEARVKRERAMLAAQGGGTAATQAQRERLDRAQSQISVARGQMQGIRPEQQSVSDLKARSAALDAELKEIDGMVGTVSGKGI
jgi:hypothetical protein